MAQITIDGIDDALIAKLREEADREQTPLSVKLRSLITRAAEREFWVQEVSRRSQEQTRGAGLDVDALIREDRDR